MGNYWPHLAQVRKQYFSKERKIIKDILVFGRKRGKLNVEKLTWYRILWL